MKSLRVGFVLSVSLISNFANAVITTPETAGPSVDEFAIKAASREISDKPPVEPMLRPRDSDPFFDELYKNFGDAASATLADVTKNDGQWKCELHLVGQATGTWNQFLRFDAIEENRVSMTVLQAQGYVSAPKGFIILTDTMRTHLEGPLDLRVNNSTFEARGNVRVLGENLLFEIRTINDLLRNDYPSHVTPERYVVGIMECKPGFTSTGHSKKTTTDCAIL